MMKVKFYGTNKLIPAIIKEEGTNQALMLGYMNKEALQKTLEDGFVWFWSRKRKKLWMKGEESGNKLKVKKVYLDCDRDALLIKVKLIGKTCCHTGERSCFTPSTSEESWRALRACLPPRRRTSARASEVV